jgi:hypothetical protein
MYILNKKLTILLTNEVFCKILPLFMVLIDLCWVLFSLNKDGIIERASIPIQYAPTIFQDDRDGWLKAAYSLVYNYRIEENVWQVNFWPPGQVGITTALFFLGRNYFTIILLHTLLTLFLLFVIYRKIIRKYRTSKSATFAILLLICWNFSFFNLSSLVTLILCPDYLAALIFFLAIFCMFETQKIDIRKFLLVGFLLATAAYIRVSYYQLLIFIFLIAIAYYFLSLKSKGRKQRISYEIAKRVVASSLIALMLIAPWITFRMIYMNNDLAHSVQLSEQGRFAMGVQWWDKKYKEENNALFIGAGTACILDAKKCSYFSNRDKQIAAGMSDISWGEDLDEKSREAIEVFIKNPIGVIELKLPVLAKGYFQRIAFSSIDDTFHISLDRIGMLFLILYAGALAWKGRLETFWLIWFFLLGTLMWGSLFITQVEFRYFYPGLICFLTPLLLKNFNSLKNYH